MRDLDGRMLRSRVKGKASIVRSLHSLHRRTMRFATLRHVSQVDYKWALSLCATLQGLIQCSGGTSDAVAAHLRQPSAKQIFPSAKSGSV
jgi:hypothetical protein